MRTVTLTEQGNQQIEDMLEQAGFVKPDTSLYDVENVSLVHHVNQALRATNCFSWTATISCAKARSSLWTSSPAA